MALKFRDEIYATLAQQKSVQVRQSVARWEDNKEKLQMAIEKQGLTLSHIQQTVSIIRFDDRTVLMLGRLRGWKPRIPRRCRKWK